MRALVEGDRIKLYDIYLWRRISDTVCAYVIYPTYCYVTGRQAEGATCVDSGQTVNVTSLRSDSRLKPYYKKSRRSE